MPNTNSIPVHEHGFVKLLNLSGPVRRPYAEYDAHDTDPPRVARMSFDAMAKDRTCEQDAGLADYLMRNKHTSPFEMIEVWLEMKLPIFVARQLVRHRTVSLNEVSARYVKLPAEWYIPYVDEVGIRPENVKQGRLIDGSVSDAAHWFVDTLNESCGRDYQNYEEAIERGVPPELARSFLHLNHYTHWVWKQNLHNVLHMCSLRDHSHAQAESQAYAGAVVRLLRQQLPLTMGLYDKHRKMKDE